MGNNFPVDNKEEFFMKKLIRRISATVLAAAMAMGVLMTSASAYEPIEDWELTYVSQLPSRPEGQDTRTIPSYGGGYLTYTDSIGGGNNRYVFVQAKERVDGQDVKKFNYDITTVGPSDVHKCTVQGYTITFNFYGRSSTTCYAKGTVGYNKTV